MRRIVEARMGNVSVDPGSVRAVCANDHGESTISTRVCRYREIDSGIQIIWDAELSAACTSCQI